MAERFFTERRVGVRGRPGQEGGTMVLPEDDSVTAAEVVVAFASIIEKNAAGDASVDLAQKPEVILRGERMLALGFTQMKEAQEAAEWDKISQEAIGRANFRKYYAENYPMNTFVTTKDISDLQAKYQLAHVKIDRYIGPIPDACLTEMENFRVREDDVPWFLQGSTAKIEGGSQQWIQKLCDSRKEADEVAKSYVWAPNSPFITPAKLTILAPPEFVHLQYNERIVGGIIVKDDPIVLQIVRGGYLIVTAWGEEASDPLVVNPNRN